MEQVMVSVLICTYNQESYIGQALESILCQDTAYRVEIIVGDDASTDDTAQVVKSYQNKYPDRIVLVKQSENRGATWNGYEISRRARGKYIASCDGDDCWCDPGRLQRQIDFLETHPEYSAICGRCKIIDDSGNEIEPSISSDRQFWRFEKEVYDWADFQEWKMPGQIGALVGRNVFNQYDISIFYRAHRMVGDRTNVLLYLFAGPIYCSDDVVSCYRLNNSQSHFTVDYLKNNFRYEEVCLLNSLEKFACDNGKIIDLSKIKKNRIVAAVCYWMKNPCLENMNVLSKIFLDVDFKCSFVYILLKTLILKSYYWYVLHCDRPIDVG